MVTTSGDPGSWPETVAVSLGEVDVRARWLGLAGTVSTGIAWKGNRGYFQIDNIALLSTGENV